MKLSCKRIDFTYTPGEEIFTFPNESGLSAPVIKCKKTPRKKCRFVAERRKKR